jgi:hypothetical protein
MSERDPRVDPRPGDILKFKRNLRRVTYFPDPAYVDPTVRWTDGIFDFHVQIGTWRSWAKDAQVIERGEG